MPLLGGERFPDAASVQKIEAWIDNLGGDMAGTWHKPGTPWHQNSEIPICGDTPSDVTPVPSLPDAQTPIQPDSINIKNNSKDLSISPQSKPDVHAAPNCAKCPLKGRPRVEGRGEGKTLLVGEAPGGDEVKEGEPFVGRAGREVRSTC